MIIMFPGVEIGVRSAAQPAIATAISSGLAAVPVASAAARAIGTTTRTVAVLLTTWPRTAVRTKSAASRTIGRPGPTASMMNDATRSAAPLVRIAVESGMRAPTSTTVCQETHR